MSRYCAIFDQRWRTIGTNASRLIAADLTIIERIAEISLPFGCAVQADELFHTAAEGYLRLKRRQWFDLLTLKRIHLALGNQDVLRGRELLRELRPSFGNLEDLSSDGQALIRLEHGYTYAESGEERAAVFSSLYLEIGRLQLTMGMCESAIRILGRGLDHARRLPSTGHGNAELLLRLALVRARLDSGGLAEAAKELGSIATELREARAPDCETVWLELSAQVATMQGRLGAAQQQINQIWLWAAARGYLLPALHASLNLCQLYIVLNKTLEAKALLDAVRVVATRNGWPEVRDRAERFRLVAEARARRHVSGPEPVFDLQMGSQPATPRDPSSPDFMVKTHGFSLQDFQLRSLQFQFNLGCGNMVGARKALDRLHAFRGSDSQLVHAGLDSHLAAWLYFNGDFAAALPDARQACAAFREMGMLPDLWRTQRLLRSALQHLGAPAGESERLGEENESLLKQMAAFLSLEDQITFFLNKPTEHEEYLSRKIRRLQQSQSAGKHIWRRYRSAIETHNTLNELLDDIYWERESSARLRLHAEDGTKVTRQSTPLWKRLLRCPMDVAQLAFLVLPDSVVVITIAFGRLRHRVLRTSRVRIRELVRQWHQAVPDSRPDIAARAASLLCQELEIESILNELHPRVKRITVLPDDALHGFPFAALPLRNGFLIEHFAVSIGFQPGRHSIRRPAKASQSVHLAGMTEGTPPLPGTAAHIRNIQAQFAEQGVETKAAFNDELPVDRLLQFLESATMFHISCHGEYAQNSPEATGWQIVTGKSTTELIGLARLFRLDLTRVHHATVMSCWGADNFVFPGRWVMSLPEVLWRAGAGSVAACLWEVSEECVSEFVGHFYANLRTLSVDRAAQAASIAMLKRGGGRREPFDWAGFQVYGEPATLRF